MLDGVGELLLVVGCGVWGDAGGWRELMCFRKEWRKGGGSERKWIWVLE